MLNEPEISEYLNGDIKVYDNVFSPPMLDELVRDVQSWSYLYGEVDDIDHPPTGLSTGEYDNTKTFHTLWAFLEEHVPCVSGSVVKRTHANLFAPRELANYHVDDEGDDAWTFMFYANNNWEINQGGETKFITNFKQEFKQEGSEPFPHIIAIPPIPGRMIIFKSNLLHTATPFKDFPRFTPTIKFVPYDPEIHKKGPIRLNMKETYPWRNL